MAAGCFFAGRDGRVRSVTIRESPTLSVSPETTLFDLGTRQLRSDSWDMLADGRLVAIQNGEGEREVSSYHVVVPWRTELLALMERRAR